MGQENEMRKDIGSGEPHAVDHVSSILVADDETLKRLVERHLPSRDANATLTLESRLRDFGVDSLLAVVLSLAIQEFYSIDFPIEALSLVMFGTLGELQEKIRELVREATRDSAHT